MNRPPVVAGWVGVGVAVLVILSFELVVAIQALVFLAAIPVGLLIGWYAGLRERGAGRPAEARTATTGAAVGAGRGRGGVLAAGLIAGAMTALALALLYVSIRLVFFYFDTGFRAGGAPYDCASGPECGYQRALDEPSLRSALETAGVGDAAGYAAFFLEGQAAGGATLVVLVLGGALAGSVVQAVAPRPSASRDRVGGTAVTDAAREG